MAISLEGVSNQELIGRLKQFVSKEQKLTHRIVLHLAEVDRRRLYADLGYTSLFDYCVRGLSYAPASAQRRIRAARAIHHVPEVYDCLESGALSLGTVEIVADALTGKNARELVKDVCGKTRDEARRIVAMHFPIEPSKLADKIEPIVVRKASAVVEGQGSLFDSDENSNYFRAEVQNEVGNCEDKYRISFTASEELAEKLERTKELLSGSFGPKDLASVIERIADEYLERHCPEVRNRRRREKEERKKKRTAGKVWDGINEVCDAAEKIVAVMPERDRDPADRRFPSEALRDKIFERDGNCCTYVAPDGTKCGATVGLQIDHIKAFGLGGRTVESNLRVVCRTHNLMFARKVWGDQRIDSILERRKPGLDGRPTVSPQTCDPNDWMAEEMMFE